ncbi:hypothetical protein [Maricaulis parjimensis]|uniref:hypothetical protein n=1 Tax=Maricaulis parjimensis TaxID=144023 RepID=UPI00193944D7|nr:hypothetical protein [Maricaulis parjimensis]
MKHHLLTALAAGSLVAIAWPQGDALAQSRAAAEAAMEQLGIADNSGFDGRMTYGEANWSNGRYILSDVVLSFPDSETDDEAEEGDYEFGNEFETARIERMIFDMPRLDDSGSAIFDGWAVEGMQAVDGDSSDVMRIGYLGASGINAEMAQDLVRAITRGDESFEPDWESWRFEDLRLEGLEVESEEAGQPTRMSLAQFALHDHTDLELGQFIISGFTLDGPGDSGPIAFRLDEFSVTGFKTEAYSDLMSVIAAGGSEDDVMSAYYQSILSPQMDLFDQFAVRGLLVDAEGVHVALDNLTAQIHQRGSRYISEMTLDSMRLIPDATKQAGAQLAMALGMLGYENLELSMASNGVYDEATGRAWSEGENYVQLHEGLRLEIEQNFSGYDAYYANLPSVISDMEAAGDNEALQAELSMDMMRPIILHNFTLRLVDLSLLERALEAGAAAQGITTDELRMQAGAMVGMGMMSAPPEIPRPLLSQLSGALTNFINTGGTLTIDATPPEPISFGAILEEIEAGTFDYNDLGLSFTTEAP